MSTVLFRHLWLYILTQKLRVLRAKYTSSLSIYLLFFLFSERAKYFFKLKMHGVLNTDEKMYIFCRN